MKLNRLGESGAIPTRSRRFYNMDDKWYFLTRRGAEHGPFKDLIEAKTALSLFLRRSGIIQLAS